METCRLGALYSRRVLFGASLPGSPFSVYVNDPSPNASNCEVAGTALNYITARSSWSFDIYFRNRSGEVAQAVDLDVYVEGLPEDPSAADLFRTAWDKATRLSPPPEDHQANVRDVPPQEGERRAERPRSRKNSKATIAPAPAVEQAKADVRAPEPTPDITESAVMEGQNDPIEEASECMVSSSQATPETEPHPWADPTRQRTLRIRVGKRPLIVRATPQLDSLQIGQLRPQQIVTVLEERIENGYVRACVTFEQQPIPLTVTGDDALETLRGFDGGPVPRAAEWQGPTSPTRTGGGGLPVSPINSPSSNHRGSISPTPSSTSTGVSPEKSKPVTGWVTLKKHGKKFVTSRLKLETTQRQQYTQQWRRRLLNDKLGADVKSELRVDPDGVGFAFGGVHPGYLHAKGRHFEKHTVSYSVGKVGRYLLHVRLRQQALPVPGSPFALTVSPGAADPKSTEISVETLPLRGSVGLSPDDGCKLILRTADTLGNMCTRGGAPVLASCDNDAVQIECTDLQDGTYNLQWRAKQSGLFQARIDIGTKPVQGSPIAFKLMSTIPELSRCDVDGDGLSHAIAGEPASVRIKFYDSFGNIACPGDNCRLGIGMASDKKKLQDIKALPFEGKWTSDDSGEYVLTYRAAKAGHTELHVWYESRERSERLALPNSPFNLQVVSGLPNATKSQIQGWTKEQRGPPDKAHTTKPKQGANSTSSGDAVEQEDMKITAGDQVLMRPMILDEFGNQAQLAEGTLSVNLVKPDGSDTPLGLVTTHVKGSSLPYYEIKTETQIAGEHSVHVLLNGNAISGSPVVFTVSCGPPDPERSALVPPDKTDQLPTDYEKPTTVMLKTFDKFGNACTFGGLLPQGRLTVVKQGVADNTLLMPNNHQVTVDDLGDGTYAARIQIKIPASVKLIVNMDKNLPSQAGELQPVQLTFGNPLERMNEIETSHQESSPSQQRAGAPVGMMKRRTSFSMIRPAGGDIGAQLASATVAARRASVATVGLRPKG